MDSLVVRCNWVEAVSLLLPKTRARSAFRDIFQGWPTLAVCCSMPTRLSYRCSVQCCSKGTSGPAFTVARMTAKRVSGWWLTCRGLAGVHAQVPCPARAPAQCGGVASVQNCPQGQPFSVRAVQYNLACLVMLFFRCARCSELKTMQIWSVMLQACA